MSSFKIGSRDVGGHHPCYLIAEVAQAHEGSLGVAHSYIDAAADCGVDAIKLQTYTPETMTLNQSKGDFMIKNGLWKGKSLYKLYEEAHTPLEWHNEIFKYSRKLKLLLPC